MQQWGHLGEALVNSGGYARLVPIDLGDRELTPHERALEAVKAINAGANPAYEAYVLANEFTDRHTARLWAWLTSRRSSSRDAGDLGAR